MSTKIIYFKDKYNVWWKYKHSPDNDDKYVESFTVLGPYTEVEDPVEIEQLNSGEIFENRNVTVMEAVDLDD